jgi:tRNA 2-thiouridine synthesizing protein A
MDCGTGNRWVRFSGHALRERAMSDLEWNAGDLGCGDLVLQLRFMMDTLEPGQVLRLVALDPGAPADLSAWCRMTGHAMLTADHPVYLIRRKEH